MKKRIYLFCTMVICICIMFITFTSFTQEWQEQKSESWKPTNDVKILCGYNVGGSTDLFARIVAKHLSNYWGVNVIVENITGGSGAIATTKCYNSKPDGYTVFVSNGATLTQSSTGAMEWRFDEFSHIAKMIDEDEILCASKESGFKTLDDLIESCKNNPGERTIAVAGVGGYTYLVAHRFLAEKNLDVKIVAYDSGVEAVTAVMGGFADFCIQQPAEVASGIESEKLVGLVIFSDEPHINKILHEIPTGLEIEAGMRAAQWRGISGPPNMPDNVKAEWANALIAIANSEDFQKEVSDVLFARTNYLSGVDFSDYLADEYDWISSMMQTLGLVKP